MCVYTPTPLACSTTTSFDREKEREREGSAAAIHLTASSLFDVYTFYIKDSGVMETSLLFYFSSRVRFDPQCTSQLFLFFFFKNNIKKIILAQRTLDL